MHTIHGIFCVFPEIADGAMKETAHGMQVRCSTYMEVAVARSNSYLSFARKAAKVLHVYLRLQGWS